MKTIFTYILFFSVFSTPSFATDYCTYRKQDRECVQMVGNTIGSCLSASLTGYAASIAPDVYRCIFCSSLSGACGCIALLIPAYDIYRFYNSSSEDKRAEIAAQMPQIEMSATPATQPTQALRPGWNQLR